MTLYEDVVLKLESAGLTITENDVFSIEFLCGKTEEYILNYCNISSLPAGLRYAAAEYAFADYMIYLSSKGVVPDSIDLSGAVSSIKEGDTQITFASPESSNPSGSWISCLESIKAECKTKFERYKRIGWNI